MYRFFDDRQFIKKLALLAVPIFLNELLNSAVNMLDTFMVGTLGDAPVAAVGLGNQVFFLFTLLCFGINSGTAVFMGQYVGKGELDNVHRTMGLALTFAVTGALLFMCAALFLPETIMHIYSKDEAVIAQGCKYLRTIAPSYVLTAIVITFNSALKVDGCAIQPMTTTLIAFVTNFIANYIFIFELKLDVRGAAMGTLAARSVEIAVQFALMAINKRRILTTPSRYFRFSWEFCRSVIPVALPVVLNEVLWSLGTTSYNIAYKYSGTLAQSAVQIASTVQNLFMVAGMGIGAACAIILSNTLGAGDKDKALDYSKRCMFFGIFISVIMGILLALSAPLVVSIFNVDELAKQYAYKMLMIVSAAIVVKTITYVSICGILRSGGDTRFCLILETCSVWLIGLPMAILGSVILRLPIYTTFAMVCMEEVIKSVICIWRIRQKKWLKTLV